MATMQELYQKTPYIKNALLNPDGSVQDVNGNTLLPENAARRRIYEGLPFIKNALINADGTTQKISDSGGGGGGGLSAVTHDDTLAGAGTVSSPLKISQAILDQLNATISSEQDPENAGKVFIVDEDGSVVLTTIQVEGVPEAPIDNKLYGRKDAGWEEIGTIQETIITLETGDWDNKTAIKTVAGITATSMIWYSAMVTSLADFANFGLYMTGQGSDEVTFTCRETPDINISILVRWQ